VPDARFKDAGLAESLGFLREISHLNIAVNWRTGSNRHRANGRRFCRAEPHEAFNGDGNDLAIDRQ
jgi:hypothetical protein